MSNRLFDLLARHRGLAAAALLGITAVAVGGAVRVSFDNSYGVWFVRDDPALVAYDAFVAEFGPDAAIVVVLPTGGAPFSPRTLDRVDRLSKQLDELPGVADVWSLSTAEAMRDVGGAIDVGKLIRSSPSSSLPPDELAFLREQLASSPLYRPLVSEDGSATVVVLTVQPSQESFEPTAALVREVRRLVEASGGGALAGAPVLDEATYRYSQRDLLRYGPAMLLLVVVALFLVFRSLTAVVFALGVVLLSVLWSYGFMGWMGWDASVLTTVLVPMLAAVGIADTIHLLTQLRHQGGAEAPGALRRAYVAVLRPCLITSVTTSAGMAALGVALMPAMRHLGVAAAVGVMAAFVLTVVGVPVGLSALPVRFLGGLGRPTPPARRLEGLTAFAIRHRLAVVLGATVLVALAAVGIGRLGVGTRLLSYFFTDDPVYRDALAADQALGGAHPLQVLVEARGEGDLLEPPAMERVEAIARLLDSKPATGQPLSGLDFVTEARRVFRGDPPGVLARPGSAAEAAQLLLMLESGDDRIRYLSLDNRRARVEVPVAASSYEELVAELPLLEEELAGIAGDVISARVTGLALLMGRMEAYLLASQLRSFALAFALVIGVIALAFRSVRIGLLSTIPNLLPLALVLGAMGWLGIQLDATTAMVAPILLGIAVDDTVHLLQGVQVERRAGGDVPQAFTAAAGRVGRALVLTTVVLVLGFLTPLLGSFKPNLHFALLSALALVLALLADLVVFPAVATLIPGLVPRS